MTALVIILSILAVIVLLLLFSLNLYIDYNADNIKVWVKYLFIKIPVYPPKDKKEKKKKPDKKEKKKSKKPQKEKKENFFISTVKSQGLSAVIEILEKILQILKDFSSSTLKHFKIKKLNLNVTMTGEDAADAALNFGYACSVLYPALGALSGLIRFLNIPNVNITVDYDKKETSASLMLQFKMRLIFLIAIILKYGIKTFLLYIDVTRTDTIEEQNQSAEKENKTAENQSA